jgi:hypothetical protein
MADSRLDIHSSYFLRNGAMKLLIYFGFSMYTIRFQFQDTFDEFAVTNMYSGIDFKPLFNQSAFNLSRRMDIEGWGGIWKWGWLNSSVKLGPILWVNWNIKCYLENIPYGKEDVNLELGKLHKN